MIVQLRGTLLEKSYERVVVDVQGVAYAAMVSLQTLAELPGLGEPVVLKTYLQVREDAHLLYGFITDEERRVFELCLGVSGIGPKMALALLSAMRPEALVQAVASADVARLQRTPGIGKKTAERLVVELRDRFDKLGLTRGPSAAPRPRTGTEAAVVSALVNLGYRASDAERAAAEAFKQHGSATLEVVLREALRLLTEVK